MKITILPVSLLAAIAVSLSIPSLRADDAKPAAVSEEAALASFKKGAEEIKAMQKSGDKTDPLARLTLIKPMLAKMKAIKTEGLPADLKTAWEEMMVKTEEMAAIFKDMPEKAEEIKAWAQKTFSDPEVSKKLQKIGTEGKAAGKKMKEAAKKYGIEIPE
ncbi:MAG TPA: hypothetical protein VHM91_09645 [Verrucomicrobiales bacterium]|jgi:hypothetical protein|nr:hypothetical protein [Verrucomicrobiales bacterium]